MFVVRDGNLLGSVDIANRHQSVSVTRLCEAIVDCFNLKLLELYHNPDANSMQAGVLSALTRHSVPTNEGMACETVRLPLDITVSVVIATLDRPDDLHRCLNCLVSQETSRQAEIIVVDRNPSSGLTAPVVAEFSAAPKRFKPVPVCLQWLKAVSEFFVDIKESLRSGFEFGWQNIASNNHNIAAAKRCNQFF